MDGVGTVQKPRVVTSTNNSFQNFPTISIYLASMVFESISHPE